MSIILTVGNLNKQWNKYCHCKIPLGGLKICRQLFLFVEIVNDKIFHREMIATCF